MKKISILLLSLLAVAGAAQAEILLSEDFNYPIGSDICDNGWLTTYGATSCGITVTGNLDFNGENTPTSGAALLDCESGSQQPHIHFEPATGGDLYISFLFQPTINQKKGYFFCLRDAISASTFRFNARVFIGENNQLGLTFADNQKAVFAGPCLQQDEVYLILLRYSMISGSRNDSVALYCFAPGDIIPSLVPATPLISACDPAKDDITPENVVLRSYDNKGWLVIDRIRVATTWTEAIDNLTTRLSVSPREPNTYKEMHHGRLLLRTPHGLYDALGRHID